MWIPNDVQNVRLTLMVQKLKVFHVNNLCIHFTHCFVVDASSMTAFYIVSNFCYC